MKTILLTAILIYAGLTNAQTWCPTGAEWTYNYYSITAFGYEKLVYEKDTVVLSQPCKKIIGNLVVPHHITWGVPPTGIDTIPVNPIFTFSQGDTVFTFYHNSFRPVYFFNAQVGDTLPYYNFMLPYNNFTGCDTVLKQVVDSTGTLVINSDTLRFYVARHIDFSDGFLYPGTVTIVERLGALNNFFVPYFTCYTDGEEYALRCYRDDNFATYQTEPITACDYVYTGLQDFEKSSISISPNPTQNILTISSSLNVSIESINIYNIVGQLQKQTRKVGSQTISTIDVSDFQDGTYFLQLLSSSGQTMTSKFIKQTH